MKRFKGAICGTLLALSVTLASAWAQDAAPASPDDKPSPAIQQEQEQSAPPQQAQNGPLPPPEGQSLSNDPNAPEPPSRVARLQYMSGSVSIQPQGTGDWAAGVINRPLTSSDNIWTDKDSRAELNVGSGLIRMDSESSLTLTGVTDNSTQLELHQGSLSLRVRDLAQGETYEIDTPNTAFTVQTPGEYRVDVNSNGNSSLVTVWRGEGQASTNGSNIDVKAGQQARFGDGSSGNGDIAQAGAPDSFDTWCQGRDQRDRNSVSARYVSPDVIGSEDLDEYGTWRDTPDYGEVWTPSDVSADWAPYHDGRWDWVSPWGWTWVDDEPWGFAPFHYGRWVYGSGYWGWAPGPYWGRPFYAPALVGWFGGAGWGFGLGFGFGGGIGWCPLGWGEPFFPWYHTGWGYFNRINIYNTRINNIGRFREGFGRPGFGAGFHYANLNAPGGRFAVSQRVFANSMSVRNQGVRMSASQFDHVSLGSRVPVSPTRVSRLGGVGRAAAVPPARAFSRATVSRASLGGDARVANRGTSTASFARSNGAAVNSRSAVSTNRGFSSTSASSHYVPRPPSSTANFNRGLAAARTSPSYRSSSSAANRSYGSQSHGSQNYGSRSYSAQSSARGNSNYVPRPSGPVRSSEYASNGYRGYSSPSYSSRGSYGNSYGGSYRESYGGSYRSYSGAANRTYSQPSYRSYAGSPSYRGYSAPSSRGYSGRSYSAPSYHGSSAGGHSYSGGGGSHYSGGGGGHSSGGGGGHGGGGRR